MTLRQRLGRGAWALASQGLSTITNLLLAILVARGSSQGEFGGWALAYVAYVVVLTINRAIICTPLLIGVRGEASGAVNERLEARGAVGASSATGILSAGVLILISYVGPQDLRTATLALAVVMPGLLVQDVGRHVHFSRRHPRAAARMDATWALLQLIGFGAILYWSGEGVLYPTLVWGVAGGISGLVGMAGLDAWPSPSATTHFLRRHARSSASMGTDAGLLALSNQAVPAVVALFGGLGAAGALRAGQTLYGPIGTLVMGLTPFALAELRGAQSTARSVGVSGLPTIHKRVLVWWIGGMALFSGIYSLFVLAIPPSVGRQLLGESWSGAETVLVPLAVQAVLRGGLTGPPLVLRAYHRLRDMVRLRVILVLPAVSFPAVGTIVDGAAGAAWGLAAFAGFATAAGIATVWRPQASVPETSRGDLHES